MYREAHWRLRGGLDLQTPRIERARNPGTATIMVNYESVPQGYRRIDGYERFDGRAKPSDVDDATMRETRRAAIGAVPGRGRVLGLWFFKNVLYAFRQNADDDYIDCYRATEIGWSKVELGYWMEVRLLQNQAGPSPYDGISIGDGTWQAEFVHAVTIQDTISDPSEQGVFYRQEIWVLKAAATGGTPAADDVLTWTGKDANATYPVVVRTPQVSRIGLASLAHMHFRSYNFFAAESGERIYGTSGNGGAGKDTIGGHDAWEIHRPSETVGEVFTPIFLHDRVSTDLGSQWLAENEDTTGTLHTNAIPGFAMIGGEPGYITDIALSNTGRLTVTLSGRLTSSVIFADDTQLTVTVGGTALTVTNLLNLTIAAEATFNMGSQGRAAFTAAANGEELTVRLQGRKAGKPGKPSSFTATAGAGRAVLAAMLDDDGGTALTGWWYRHKLTSAQTFNAWRSIAIRTTTLSHTVTGLTNGEEYTFEVRAANRLGTGPSADEATVTPQTVPGTPTVTLTGGFGEIVISASADNGGSAITGWQFKAAATSGGLATASWTTIADASGDAATHTITGLGLAVTRFVQVRAVNANGNGAASAEDSATTIAMTAPLKPTGFTVTATTDREFRLQASVNNGGAAITKWQRRSAAASADVADASWEDIASSAADDLDWTTSTTFAYEAERFYQVRAVNSEGNGAASDIESATQPQAPVVVAGTLSITDIPGNSINEGQSHNFAPAVTGGTYDTVEYAYTVLVGGGSFTGSTYIAPAVTSDAAASIRVTATFEGTGTVARDGTSATDTATDVFVVKNAAVITRDTDRIYIRGTSAPGTPAGGTGSENDLPSGASRSNPGPTTTLNVYRSTRTRTYSDGAFTMATAWSAWGLWQNKTGSAPGVPGVPRVTRRTANSITVQTTRGSGGVPTSYTWRYSTNSSVTGTDPSVSSTGTSVTITGLTAGTNYWIDVSASNAFGSSSFSGNRATSTTAAPVLAPGVPRALGERSDTTRSVTMAWLAPSSGGSVTSYTLRRYNTRSGGSVAATYAGITGTSRTVTGLSAGTTYYWTIQAIGPGGTGSESSRAPGGTESAPVGVGVGVGVSATSATSVKDDGTSTGRSTSPSNRNADDYRRSWRERAARRRAARGNGRGP